MAYHHQQGQMQQHNAQQGQQPSPVLMLRTVPQGATEKDIEAWANQYTYNHPTEGPKNTKCVKTLLLTDKDIGFVQMSDVNEAQYLMDLYQKCPEQIQMNRPDGTQQGLNLVFSDKQEIRAQNRTRNQIPTSQTRILLVVLKSLSATIMMDELFWIFSQFGTVEKLSSFTKNMKNQVLVQYQTQDQASLAMAYLNGKEITFNSPQQQQPDPAAPAANSQGSCHLAIVPSKLPELTFKNQDQKNRDYTQINDQLRWQFLQARMGQVDLKHALQTLGSQWSWRIRDFLWGVWVLGDGWCDPAQEKGYQGQIPVDPASQGKGIPEGNIGDCIHVSGIPYRQEGSGNSQEGEPEGFPPIGGFNAEMLWRVFGMHGSIIAVKLLYKYPGCAIIQYKNQRDAQQARENLDGIVFGKRWEVKESKNANAMHWSGAKTELQQRMCTIADNGITPPRVPPTFLLAKPSDTLLLFDLPEGVNQEELAEIFRQAGKAPTGNYGGVLSCEVSSEGGRATVHFESMENAVVAAAMLNGVQVHLPSQASKDPHVDPRAVNTTLHVHFDKKRTGARPPVGVEGLLPPSFQSQPAQHSDPHQHPATPGAGLVAAAGAASGIEGDAEGQPLPGGLNRNWTC